MKNETIVAIASAHGEGAIGIIRLSGDDSLDILKKIFRTKSMNKAKSFRDKQMKYGFIVNDNNQVIDEVMVTYMIAPKTYTVEDVVEIYCHGGIVSLRSILKVIVGLGVKIAEPGEFTKRAFLNGRLDLSQAEAVMDLISAKTSAGFDIAMEQLKGTIATDVTNTRNKILKVMADLEVSIDYPEEDIEEVTYKEILETFRSVSTDIEKLLEGSDTGKIIREGLSIAIVGKPNVGKSSLMNALLKESRAIVTDIPGTTRDLIEEFLSLKGVPIKLIDTAGIRNTDDVVEKIGVGRSKEIFNKSDLVIFLLNSSEKLSEEDIEIMDLVKNKNAIVLINKSDLDSKIEIEKINVHLGHKKIIRTSLIDGSGLEELEKSIVELVYKGDINQGDQNIVSNIRHITALENADVSIKEAIRATESGLSYDFIQVDVINTYNYLGEILGETIEGDIVKKIFSNFCLGK